MSATGESEDLPLSVSPARSPSSPGVDGETTAFEAALLWLDLSGFTPRLEQLSREGHAGTEWASELLQTYYGTVAEEAARRQGALVMVAGDGALAVWAQGPDRRGIEQANQTAAAIHERLIHRDGAVRPLEARSVVSAGPVQWVRLGGVGGRWLRVLAGPAIQDLPRLAAAARRSPGDGRARPSRPTAPPRPEPPAPVDVQALAHEIRTVSVVFAGLANAEQERDLQRFVVGVQTLAERYDATLHQVVRDDKGLTAVVAFGLPGRSHDDDAERAVRFAREIRGFGAGADGGVRCGVATGQVFCGPFTVNGDALYVLVGTTMNRASRLMGAAGDGPLLDQATFDLAGRRLGLEEAGSLTLKGLGSLPAYRWDAQPRRTVSPPRLFGREAELRAIDEALPKFGSGGAPPLLLEGASGLGKSALLAAVVERTERAGLAIAFAVADPIERRTPFYALVPLLRAILGVPAAKPETAAWLATRLAALGEDAALAPIVAPVLGEALDETTASDQVTGTARAQARRRLLAALVAEAVRERAWVAVVDDVHWLDEGSWTVISGLHEDVPKLGWVLSARPEAPPPAEYDRLRAMATSIALAPLDAEALGGLVVELEGAAPSVRLLGALGERTSGNPLFAREMLRALRRSDRLISTEAGCDLRATGSSLDLPVSLSALLRSRLDTLAPRPQRIVKMASVLGRAFEREVLMDCLRAREDPVTDADLAALERDDVLAPSDGRLAFTHALVQEAAYDLLLPRQRSVLHRQAAEALEARYAADPTPVLARLCHHWTEAKDASRAADYAARLARRALDVYANQEALALYERALRLADDAGWTRAGEPRVVDLHFGRAQAHYSLTQPAEAHAAYAAAVTAAGLRPPGFWTAVRGILRLCQERVTGYSVVRRRQLTATDRARAEGAIRTLDAWAALDVWQGRMLQAIVKGFAADRLGHRVLESPAAAEVISGLGYVAGLTPLRRVAEARLRAAIALADDSGDPEVRASTRVLLGMHYTLLGRPAEAVGPLLEAQAPAERLGSGLWKHRARFQLGEPLLLLGRYEEAAAAYAEAGELARNAEPPVRGLATAMEAAILNRQARFDEALARADGPNGLAVITGDAPPVQRFAALGTKIDALVALDRLDEALRAGAEAERLLEPGRGCTAFLVGLHGHEALARLYLAVLARASAHGSDLRTRARLAIRRLARFAAIYPVAGPAAWQARGRWRELGGRARRAERCYRQAALEASRMELAHERQEAHAALARLGVDPAALLPAADEG